MQAMSTTNPLHALAIWAAEHPRDWSTAAKKTAHNAVIDITACMIAGTHEKVISKLWSVVSLWGDGKSNVAGYPKCLSAPLAALVNGTSAHALDYDDIFDPAKAHATAVIFPALMALADETDKSADDLLDAYIVGLQILGEVGQGVNPFHRNRGWHATGTLGTLGAAAACARLLGLSAEKTAHAISISTSLAGGFMSQFGSDTKCLHAGFAAAGGVQAAMLARAGITAGETTLDGQTGLQTLMVGPDVEQLRESMIGKEEYGQNVTFSPDTIGEPLHVEKFGLKVKRFPNCGSVHRALDGLLQLRDEYQFEADEVEEVFIRAPAGHLHNLAYDRPKTPLEAKFSLEYGLAVGLLTGSNTLDDFTPKAVLKPEVQAMLPRIRKEYVPKLESDFYTQIQVRLKDGTIYNTEANMPVGSNAEPLTDAQLWAKFDACLHSVANTRDPKAIKDALKAFSGNYKVKSLSSLL